MDDRATTNADLTRRGYEAFASGNVEALQETFSPDLVWHVTRLGELSGDHKGFGEVMAFFTRTMELTRGTFTVQVREILANDQGAAAVVRSRAERDGKTLDSHQIHHFHIEDGRVIEVWQLFADGREADEFWS